VKWRVRAPATCANLGPGFDLFALALDLCNEVIAEKTVDAGMILDPGPRPAAGIERGPRNLILRSYIRACEELGVQDDDQGARLTCTNRIPMTRGLGSSAAAIVSGVAAAYVLHGRDINVEAIAEIATRIEGHPENVAAAAMGGFVICAQGTPTVSVPVMNVSLVLFIPESEASTQEARTVVPLTFSREDTIFNAGRCALLARAFTTGDFRHLAPAMEDRMHQPYRARSQPALYPVIRAAGAAGAYGAALSGSGTSILALSRPNDGAAVATAMSHAAETVGVAGATIILEPRNRGLEVEALRE